VSFPSPLGCSTYVTSRMLLDFRHTSRGAGLSSHPQSCCPFSRHVDSTWTLHVNPTIHNQRNPKSISRHACNPLFTPVSSEFQNCAQDGAQFPDPLQAARGGHPLWVPRVGRLFHDRETDTASTTVHECNSPDSTCPVACGPRSLYCCM
jgi:hypothetical protein